MEFVGAARGGEFGGRTVQHHDGAPLGARFTSIDFHGTEPAPTLSDFMTASLAAKRAASRSALPGRRAAHPR